MACLLSPGVPIISFAVLMICSFKFVSICSRRPNNLSSFSFVISNVSANSPALVGEMEMLYKMKMKR